MVHFCAAERVRQPSDIQSSEARQTLAVSATASGRLAPPQSRASCPHSGDAERFDRNLSCRLRRGEGFATISPQLKPHVENLEHPDLAGGRPVWARWPWRRSRCIAANTSTPSGWWWRRSAPMRVGYRFYSKFIAAKVLTLDALRATPAERLENGRDFVPHQQMGRLRTSLRRHRRARTAGRSGARGAIRLSAGNALDHHRRGVRRLRAGLRDPVVLGAARRQIARPRWRAKKSAASAASWPTSPCSASW